VEWAIAGHYPRQHLSAGTTLFREGGFGTSMYFVVAGSLRVSKRVIEGADKILSTLGAGQYVGEMCLLTGGKTFCDRTGAERFRSDRNRSAGFYGIVA
jgi:CRP-like cAMP-binding protein